MHFGTQLPNHGYIVVTPSALGIKPGEEKAFAERMLHSEELSKQLFNIAQRLLYMGIQGRA